MVFGFQKMMDFTMDIDKLNLANLVMYEIMEGQICLDLIRPSCP